MLRKLKHCALILFKNEKRKWEMFNKEKAIVR